jgi:8-hydroxy-5-deazaflavin:NADPH oxidoreductase
VSCQTSILGSGNIGAALARRFAAKDISVGIANRQSPDMLDALVRELGPRVMPQRVPDAVRSEIIILAIPFGSVPDATRNFIHTWSGKIVVDATNPHTVAEIRGKSSTADVAACVPGAAVVKAFNTLPAAVLAADPQTGVGRRVLFLSSYDADAAAAVSTLIQGLGFAPIPLSAIQTRAVCCSNAAASCSWRNSSQKTHRQPPLHRIWVSLALNQHRHCKACNSLGRSPCQLH